MSARARVIYGNVERGLREQNAWQDVYKIPLEVLAVKCDDYLDFAEQLGPGHEITREARRDAREMLKEFQMIDVSRIPTGAVDQDGVDVDIRRLVEESDGTQDQ